MDEQKKFEDAREKKLVELMNDEALFSRGSSHVYQGDYLEAIDFPVGGIGAGYVRY